MNLMTILLLVLGLGAGGAGGFYYRTNQLKGEDQKKRREQDRALQDAKNKANDIVLKAKNEAMKAHEESQKEERIKRKKFEETHPQRQNRFISNSAESDNS